MTYDGGIYNLGAVFELTTNADGGWTENTLHNFGIDGTDGTGPNAGLIWDAAGNLYGTTSAGGIYSDYGGQDAGRCSRLRLSFSFSS